MRPVNKGLAPELYSNYGDARYDLADIIGYYCSYCEMKVYHSIEVEHILPQNQGGDVISWDNFLLSCKYCNTIKSDRNNELDSYLWPDRDNTDLAFTYEDGKPIRYNSDLNNEIKDLAIATIDLTGIDRMPGFPNEPTKADTRWRSREEVWSLANISYTNWGKCKVEEMAIQIAQTAITSGHYSIWRSKFINEELVLDKINEEYLKKGLFIEIDASGNRLIRVNGKI